MMHADLIDEVDLVNQLRSLGFEVSGSAEQACKSAVFPPWEFTIKSLWKPCRRMHFSTSSTMRATVEQPSDRVPG